MQTMDKLMGLYERIKECCHKKLENCYEKNKHDSDYESTDDLIDIVDNRLKRLSKDETIEIISDLTIGSILLKL